MPIDPKEQIARIEASVRDVQNSINNNDHADCIYQLGLLQTLTAEAIMSISYKVLNRPK